MRLFWNNLDIYNTTNIETNAEGISICNLMTTQGEEVGQWDIMDGSNNDKYEEV